MMKTFLTFVTCFIVGATFAQTKLSFSSGGYTVPNDFVKLSDFNALAPRSILYDEASMKNDSMFTNVSKYSNSNYATKGMLSLEFTPPSGGILGFPEKSFRLGLGFADANVYNMHVSKNRTGRYDTLVSNQTGEEHFIDTTYTEEYYFSNNSKSVFVNASFLLSSSSDRRLVVKTGMGTQMGISISSVTNVKKYVWTNNKEVNNKERVNEKKEEEKFINKPQFSMRLFAPIEFSYRISKKEQSFLNKLHLMGGFQPGIQLVNTPEVGGNTFLYSNVVGGLTLEL